MFQSPVVHVAFGLRQDIPWVQRLPVGAEHVPWWMLSVKNLLGVCGFAQSVITVRLKNPPCLAASFPRAMHSSYTAILAVAS